MKTLSLDSLTGPGRSQDENFEIMCLALAQADLPGHEVFRHSAPDGGIDIYARSPSGQPNYAFQCKAYSIYRADLLDAISRSVSSANRSRADFPCEVYYLLIPFAPTLYQRKNIQERLNKYEGRTHISDGDELEATLFRHPEVARRFFPTIKLITPREQMTIVLGMKDDPELLDLGLHIHTWGQTIPTKVSPKAKTGSLLQLLIGQLALPVEGAVQCIAVTEYEIRWRLVLEGAEDMKLEPQKTFAEQGIKSGAQIALVYEFECVGQMKAWGGFRGSLVKLVSYYDARQHSIPKGIDDFDKMLAYWIDHELPDAKRQLQSQCNRETD